ncbi:MAG TPA: polysaccharide biosynthesis/export family protein [Stellaceae bacterium]|nr:polysaccharide biosynthesis/export family protein [Stellaceae bacterium]
MKLAALRAGLLALALAACSGEPLREDVIAQAQSGGQVAFDVVKIDDAVLKTVLAQPQPAFHEQFRKYLPPPDLKVAVGDTIGVVIWESAANGLFGNSLTELSLEAGASARLLTGETPTMLGGVPSEPQGLAASPETFASLFGGAPEGQSSGSGPGLDSGAARDLKALQRLTAGLDPPEEQGAEADQRLGAAAGFGRGAGRRPFGGGEEAGADIGVPAIRGYNVFAGPPPLGDQREPGTATGRAPSRVEALVKLAKQSGRPGTRIPDQQVGPDGAISIPYAGRIAIAGRTPLEAERMIEQRLGPKALDPQALVFVRRSAANSVSVAGEIVGGKRVALSPGGDRLLQVIAAAGGAKAPVHETFVRLSRGGVTASVPLATLVADPAQDIFAEPGDVLTLVRRRQTFSVFGATGKNTAITFNRDRLSLSEALAKAGGLLDYRADPRAVFLFRYEPVSLVRALGQPIASGAPPGVSPIVYRLDLNEARSYLLARQFPMRDKDVIFVANAETHPVYKVFRALSQVTGPVWTGFLTCHVAGC